MAERFEIYIAGVELANGFTELNDPSEQRVRFEAELLERRSNGAAAYPIDEAFLEAMEAGIPPAGAGSRWAWTACLCCSPARRRSAT